MMLDMLRERVANAKSTAYENGLDEWFDGYVEEIQNAPRNHAGALVNVLVTAADNSKALIKAAALDTLLEGAENNRERVSLALQAIDGEDHGRANVNHACMRLIQTMINAEKENKGAEFNKEERKKIGEVVRENIYTNSSLQRFSNPFFWRITRTEPLKERGELLNGFRIIGAAITSGYGSYRTRNDLEKQSITLTDNNFTCG